MPHWGGRQSLSFALSRTREAQRSKGHCIEVFGGFAPTVGPSRKGTYSTSDRYRYLRNCIHARHYDLALCLFGTAPPIFETSSDSSSRLPPKLIGSFEAKRAFGLDWFQTYVIPI